MEGFNFTHTYKVRICDLNYRGHVAGSTVVDYLQDARLAYLDRLGGFSELSLGDGCSMIMPELSVKYLAEMFLGDELQIGVKISGLRRAGFTSEYRIERDGKPIAEAVVPMVSFDYEARKVRSLPKEFLAAVKAFEGEL